MPEETLSLPFVGSELDPYMGTVPAQGDHRWLSSWDMSCEGGKGSMEEMAHSHCE